MPRIPLHDLSSCEYEHPLDRSTLSVLKSIPVVPKLIEIVNIPFNTLIRTNVFGSLLRVGENQLPSIYRMLCEACGILGVNEPLLYIETNPQINAYTSCPDQPIIVLSGGLLDSMDDDELMFVIGHELAHIKSQHIVYQTLGSMIKDGLINTLLSGIPGIGLVSAEVLNYAYFEWSRAAELTCDRGGLLACQNFNASCNALMKLAGSSLKYRRELNLDAFIEQGRNFQEIDTTALGKIQKVLLSRTMTHPWTVYRVNQLLKFYESTEYMDVLQRNPQRKALGAPDVSASITAQSLAQTGEKTLETTKVLAANIAGGTKGALSGFKKGFLKLAEEEPANKENGQGSDGQS